MNVGVDSTLKLLTFVELEMLHAVDGGNRAPPSDPDYVTFC